MDRVYTFASLLERAYEENILTDQSCYDLMMNKMSASTQPNDITFQKHAPHSSSSQITPVLSQGAQQLIGFDKFHAPKNYGEIIPPTLFL